MASLLREGEFPQFVERIARGRRLVVLEEAGGEYHLATAHAWNPKIHSVAPFRSVEPLKSIVFRPRESLGGLTDSTLPEEMTETVVIGVKNCDLSALAIHDHVFMKTDPVDPYYKVLREKTIIITADCTGAKDVCFCTAVGEQPYAEKGFDLNLSPLGNSFVLESGSERGMGLLEEVGSLLEKADDAALKQRDAKREAMRKKVTELAAAKGLTGTQDFQAAVRKTIESDIWSDFAEDCVECGACNYVCCTCHCFLLADGMGEGKVPARLKQWDSCLHMNFARVAGGANPRKHRGERLYNRFDKKFNYFKEILGRYACDGCGRCIEACTGKIDLRDVLKKAVDEG